ncbi:tyrosine-type recombinase/integrase [Bacillus capparidis]|uniref:Integrase n=1 Tax=Bacillus capparidis TaxID=1840411 RepID=A0ABS4D1H1_9BACI|nr:site-specific integrase [Bacillus capparidis]MBP1083474.1 integrase [Bacillus capparidis]MED1094676.1 site-specific integrase [Bacillus capparidis]
MASYQRRGKTWQYTISAKPKPIRKGGFKTKKEAAIAAAEVEANLNKGVRLQLTPIPFDEYFEKWVALYKKQLKGPTKKHYEDTHKEIQKYFGNSPIQEIIRSDYQAFINKFGSTRAKETVEKLHGHIRSCVQDAIEDGVVHVDFTRKVKLYWTVQAKKASEKHLNFKESELLLKELYKHLSEGLGYYLLLLGLTSGLRFEELVGLTRKDFDFVHNKIRVNKTWGYKKQSPLGFGPTKNEQSNRIIKIDKNTMAAFKHLFDIMPPNLHGLVFYSPVSKYKVISNTNANKLLKKVLSELEIQPITVHGLRHTYASVLLYKRVSVYSVSERLGHKDVETTNKYYAHVLKELREEDDEIAVSAFEEMAV